MKEDPKMSLVELIGHQS